MATLTQLLCLTTTPGGSDIFTYNNKLVILVFLSDSLAVMQYLLESGVRKVCRWDVRLCIYNYTWFHIALCGKTSEQTCVADRYRHWAYAYWTQFLPILSSSDLESDWPTKKGQGSSRKHKAQWSFALTLTKGPWSNKNRETFGYETMIQLCNYDYVSLHTYQPQAMEYVMHPKVLFDKNRLAILKTDLKKLVRACSQCLSITGGIEALQLLCPTTLQHMGRNQVPYSSLTISK